MRTSKEERADLRARCRAGVIAITTDAALVAALVDDVEELDADLAEAFEDRSEARDDAARAAALLAVRTLERDEARAEVDRLRVELAETRADLEAENDAVRRLCAALDTRIEGLKRDVSDARAERDARPEITAKEAEAFVWYHDAPGVCLTRERHTAEDVMAALRAHAGKVAR